MARPPGKRAESSQPEQARSKSRDPNAVLFRGATVVTCDAQDQVLRADVLVEHGRISRVGRVRPTHPVEVIDARDRLLLPGLVMAHVHLCQVLLRGMADDLPLLDWLAKRIWPLEAAHSERSMRASAELGLAEMLTAGVTTILDLGTVHHHDVVFDACVRSGMRTFGGKSLMDQGSQVPARLKETTAQSLRDAERLADTWEKHDSGRIRYAWIPRFILSCSEAQIRGAIQRAHDRGALFHTHAAEHPGEKRAVREAVGGDDVDVLRRWGMRGPRASIAHGVQLTSRQMRQLAKDQVGVVHCPSANLKLGSGIARVHELRRAGVTVAVGADGAPCNNNLDPWREMRLAAQLSSPIAGPGALPARAALRMLTIDAARLLGVDTEQGSIEVGKRADLIVVRRDELHTLPALDPIGTLVYASQARDVEQVLVGGQWAVRDGRLLTLDVAEVRAKAKSEAPRLMRRAGLR
ncbi:MAG: amidohydrolase family protein [Myxococcales bacterium]|nr:amidohydrolase family protein [Myxococcales bacterium]